MAYLFGLRIKNGPRPIELAVILELKRITADKHLRRADKTAQRLLIIPHQICIIHIRRVARHNEQYRNHVSIAARRIFVIRQILENQALIKRAK